MKKNIFVISISGIFMLLSCSPQDPQPLTPFHHMVQGTSANDISCPNYGSNCATKSDVNTYQQLTNGRFGTVTAEEVIVAFYGYYNQGNPKGIFNDPRYSIYFSQLIGNDVYQKIMNNTYRFLVAGDGSIVIVKSLTGGLTITNIVFAIDRDNVI